MIKDITKCPGIQLKRKHFFVQKKIVGVKCIVWPQFVKYVKSKWMLMGIGGALSALFCRQIDRLSAAVGGSSFDNKTTPYVGHFSSDRMRLKFRLTETTKQSIPKLTSQRMFWCYSSGAWKAVNLLA